MSPFGAVVVATWPLGVYVVVVVLPFGIGLRS